jgi:hypothetical protein
MQCTSMHKPVHRAGIGFRVAVPCEIDGDKDGFSGSLERAARAIVTA